MARFWPVKYQERWELQPNKKNGETTEDLEELSTWEERVDYEENQNAGGAA